MRDIGIRIQRYKLSRYRPPDSLSDRARMGLTLGLAAWAIWALFLSDHSAVRLMGLGQKKHTLEQQLAATSKSVDRRARDLRVADDPEEAARVLRERHNFALPGERIYRIESDGRLRTSEAPLDSM
jgi:cell division protein FtsB